MLKDRKVQITLALALAALLFVALNILSGTLLRSARIDLTDEGLYTLSDGTHRVVASLDEPVLLRFFFSQDLAADFPTLRDYGARVRDLLEEYVAASGGMIALEIVEPEPFSDEEDEAVALGLEGAQVTSGGERLYFGLVMTNLVDEREVIGFFQQEREPFLEYDLTRAVYDLGSADKPVVGLMTTLPMHGSFGTDPRTGAPTMGDPWVIMGQLQQFFEIRDLDPMLESIEPDVDVLMIVHPRDLGDKTLYAIDQFVLAGGRALVFVDPFSEIAAGQPDRQDPMDPNSSNMATLFATWGIKLTPGMIAADIDAAQQVSTAGKDGRREVVPYVVWLDLRAENFNKDEVATGQLGRISAATAGILSAVDGATTEMTPLIQTGANATEVERFYVQFAPNPASMFEAYQAKGGPRTLALRLHGTIASAYPDGPPSGEGDAEETADDAGGATDAGNVAGHIAQSAEPANLIVVADTDILTDMRWVQVQDFMGQSFAVPVADNGAFVINALDVLAGSDDLIGLRSRGSAVREFAVVDALRREADTRFRETEQALQTKMLETEQKLTQLQGGDAAGDSVVVTPEQQATIEEFRRELVATRKELRDVQHELRKDIEELGLWLKFINIGLVPILVAIAAIALSLIRRGRRRRAAGMA